MKIKRIKKDYNSREEMPEELRKDFYNASGTIEERVVSALTKKSNEQQKFIELTK